jgi:hypothetical protein
VTERQSKNRDEALRAQEQESKRRQWLGLVECIQDAMRLTLPDPNILLLINSTISTRNGGSLREFDGSNKRNQPVVEARAGKRRKKDEGYAIDEGDGAHMSDTNSAMESEEDEDAENSSALQSLAQIWGSEAISSAAGLSQSLLHAKVLEVLAAYQVCSHAQKFLCLFLFCDAIKLSVYYWTLSHVILCSNRFLLCLLLRGFFPWRLQIRASTLSNCCLLIPRRYLWLSRRLFSLFYWPLLPLPEMFLKKINLPTDLLRQVALDTCTSI